MTNLYRVFAGTEMGFFSWKTNDTGESIANKYSNTKTFDVWMIDNKGNAWHEPEYEGYGVFGGKPFYELMAEMNGIGWDEAIDKEQSPDKNTLWPNLIRCDPGTYEWQNSKPERCEGQGYWL